MTADATGGRRRARPGADATAARFDDRRDLLRPLRLFGLFFRVGALNELQYRANLAVQLFQSALASGPGSPSSGSSSARRRTSAAGASPS